MAHLIQDPEVIKAFKGNMVMKQKNQIPLDYPQLAALARDHSTPEKAVLWDSLPNSEKSLGASIVKAYSGPEKKKKKNKVEKSLRKQIDPVQAQLQRSLLSSDPQVRETARSLLGK